MARAKSGIIIVDNHRDVTRVTDNEGHKANFQKIMETDDDIDREMSACTSTTAGESDHSSDSPKTKPQHLQDEEIYFQVIYRGVVALLSEPNESSARSGAYVSYGEIIGSRRKFCVANYSSTPQTPLTPTRQTPTSTIDDPKQQVDPKLKSDPTCRTQKGDDEIDKFGDVVVRVDRVLTGGYAVDGTHSVLEPLVDEQTPKRTNAQPQSLVDTSSLSIENPAINVKNMFDAVDNDCHDGYGYLLSRRGTTPILLPLSTAPTCVPGTFLYKAVSSTPLSIYTGPCFDAPKTKGMLVPGTIHEVSLRVRVPIGRIYGWFLRLKRRRGWVIDRKSSGENEKGDFLLLMQDMSSNSKSETSGSSPTLSFDPASRMDLDHNTATCRKHHRPPRRMQDARTETIDGKGPNKSGKLKGPVPHTQFDVSNHFDYVNKSTERVIVSPSSNVSLLSEDSSFESHHHHRRHGPSTPDRSSVSRSIASSTVSPPSFFLMRVNAPRGLTILDAPHFQVNNLIRGNQAHYPNSPMGSKDFQAQQTGNQSIFQTMGGHHTTTLASRISNPAVFDSITKSRKLPRGSLFEASKRMEAPANSFHQGAGLIKLSDNSGWAIVPKDLNEQYRNNFASLGGIREGEATRAYEEVGNAVVDGHHAPIYCRILSRGGVSVSLPPAGVAESDGNTASPTSSSAGYTSIEVLSHAQSKDSDVASSVGSSFLDAMFRTPSKKSIDHYRDRRMEQTTKFPIEEATSISTVIQCGMYAEVETWVDTSEGGRYLQRIDFVRLRGGQGWLPRFLNGRPVLELIEPPDSRFGSFWFRVQHRKGIKVRMGPSRRAPSIKSDEGANFRFECGEYLRASEVVTFFREGAPSESFAKLYRNRHVRLHKAQDELRSLTSLTSSTEWVQVYGDGELYLDECSGEPRIERNKRQGWRYNVVLDARVNVRLGPSFSSDTNGVVLLGGESVLINERVIGPNDNISWLRLKDGQGWVHNIGEKGAVLMIPHSLRHRKGPPRGLSKDALEMQEELPYNAIIARLFTSHGDISKSAGTS